MMSKKWFLLILLSGVLCFSLKVQAQIDQQDSDTLTDDDWEEDEYEPYVISVSELMVNVDTLFARLQRSQSDSLRLVYNDSIVNDLQQLLKKENSFNLSFKEMRYIGKISSNDRKVNVYTWNILLHRGFLFNGLVQDSDGELYLLKQVAKPYLPDGRRPVKSNQWYGALYYAIEPYKWEGETVYLLSGWGRYRYDTQFKVLDVLHFIPGGVELGLPLFEGHNDQLHRVVLESDREASVTLQYDSRKKRFVFDHLSPMRRQGDQVLSYGPDMSFDSYVRKRKSWVLKEDIKVKNIK